MRMQSPLRSGLRARLLPLTMVASALLAACGGATSPESAAEQTRPSESPSTIAPVEPTAPDESASEQPAADGSEAHTEQPADGPALYSYCDPAAAIAAYPRFGEQVPEQVGRLYPSGGGRDYPIIDAHTHLATSSSEEAALQRQVGLYSVVDSAWDVSATASLRAAYPEHYVIQFHLGEYLKGLDAVKLPAIQTSLDGQREAGAGGIKLSKDLGLAFNDSTGKRLRVDDPRLYPLWQRAADEKWPISIHVADPDSWMERYYANGPYSKQELIQQFLRVVEDNPRTVFVAIHLLNLIDSEAELDQLSEYLARYPNLYADTSARSQYLVNLNQAHVREFMIKNQDKILFATDRAGGQGATNYEEELRYWETTGPTRTYYLNAQSRGLGLPPEVLEKFYYKNALRVFCAQLPAPN